MTQLPHYFVAVPLPDTVKEKLSKWADVLRQHVAYKTWTGKEDFHITLQFLGAASDESIDHLIHNIEIKTNKMTAPSIKIRELGGFGKSRYPRVLWAGVESSQALFDNQKQVAESCRDAGFQVDRRPYRPHITIAKKWKGSEPISISDLSEQLGTNDDGKWLANEITLYQVRPQSTPKYYEIHKISLKDMENSDEN